jgi:post-segregation antitoxin (ccd killing protein)
MNERVTVTLPAELVRDIDRLDKNRSRFIQDAARHELERRRRELLQESLRSPHPETAELADASFDDWAAALPDEHAAGLVDLRTGVEVRWVPGEGWTQAPA